MFTEREQLRKEVEGLMYEAIAGAEMALESNRFGFVADQILLYLQSKGVLHPQLQQHDVMLSLPLTDAELYNKALNESKDLDRDKYSGTEFRMGYVAGYKAAYSDAGDGNAT